MGAWRQQSSSQRSFVPPWNLSAVVVALTEEPFEPQIQSAPAVYLVSSVMANLALEDFEEWTVKSTPNPPIKCLW